MNYITEILAFYDWLIENPISANAQALWHRLMAYNNDFGWRSEFTVTNGRLCEDLCISQSELIKIRTLLHEKGLIEYQNGNKNRCGIYKLIRFDSTDCAKFTNCTPDCSTDSANSEQNRDTLDKLNNISILNNINKKIYSRKNKVFIPPTLDEVIEYCRARGNNVDAKYFYEYFTESGWVDSKGSPVKNWKQKIITWEQYAKGGKSDAGDSGHTQRVGNTESDRPRLGTVV